MSRITSLRVTALLAALIAVPIFAASPTVPPAKDLTPAFRAAALNVDRLQVFEVGGVVVIRGRVNDLSTAEAAYNYAKSLGYERVANLVQVTAKPDDEAIERAAERELTIHRGLDGCKFRVDANHGIVNIAGTVRHELQKDMAIALVRNVDGVLSVQSQLGRE